MTPTRIVHAALATLAILTILACLPAPILAQGASGPPAAALPPGVRGELLGDLRQAESKLEELTQVTPESKYAWRPGKGVRSTGAVFVHVAAANYTVPAFWGVETPAGFDREAYAKSLTTKAAIEKALKESFAYMESRLAKLSDDDMNREIELFGHKTTVRGGYIALATHMHEHLGQSIAYARMNGIVPPWTARQQERMPKGMD